jgi:O-succinylhomoserine sulfhydrylase
MNDELDNADFETRAIRYAQQRTHEHEHSEAIFMTSSFVFDNAAHAAAVFSGQQKGNIYARFHNPTVRTFEQRLASLEGGESCVATSSGMSAILATMIALLQSGDHLVASKSLFGSSIGLFDNYLKKFGIDITYVTLSNAQDWAAAVKPSTKMLFAETPSNPLTEVGDIQLLADIAHDCGAILAVDNCFCTPAIQRPLEFGADIIIHSATKYLDGQGRAVGGAVVGDSELVGDKVFSFLRTAGPTMSPFNAWIFTRGLETLALRMKAHSENARLIANWLESHSKIERVYYPGLTSHPQYDIASKQHSDTGGIIAFDVVGGQEAAWQVMDRLKLMSITANLGDVKTTITHPTSTTHHRISPEQRAAAGIGDGLLRIAAGLESSHDLITDLEQALN